MGSELWYLGTYYIVNINCLYIIRPHLSSLEVLYVWVPAPGGGAQLEERSARVISALVTGGSTRATEPLLENKYIFLSVNSSRSHNVRLSSATVIILHLSLLGQSQVYLRSVPSLFKLSYQD